MAPAFVGYLAESWGLGEAVLWISFWTWMLCFVFVSVLVFTIPADARRLRSMLQKRADMLKEQSIRRT